MMEHKWESGFLETQLNIGSALAEMQKRVGLCIPNSSTFERASVHLRKLEYSLRVGLWIPNLNTLERG
jgi:hypothetical protein